MSGVVLRCPNCGTTRAAPGECEACHEAQVRYYCTNHTPGRWLQARACPECGASFGAPARAPAAPQPAPAAPRRTPPPASAAPPRPISPARPPPPARPRSSAEAPKAADDTARRRERVPPAGDDEIDLREVPEERIVRLPSWQEMLLAAARGRRRPPAAAPDFEAAPAGRGPGGCFLRFVLLMVFLFFALVSGMFVFGSSLLRMFVPF
ncbi:MAG: hypothetical protein JWP96_1299 [Polaromonas sp.]|nr:hypothetical protein [Polaromonas sp.]